MNASTVRWDRCGGKLNMSSLSMSLCLLLLTAVRREQKGKLCYVCITQSELVLLDASRIGFVSACLHAIAAVGGGAHRARVAERSTVLTV